MIFISTIGPNQNLGNLETGNFRLTSHRKVITILCEVAFFSFFDLGFPTFYQKLK